MTTTAADVLALLRAIAPPVAGARASRQAEIIDQAAQSLPGIIARLDLTPSRRLPHFLAQIAHESDGFCTTVEYASGEAYEGRGSLGNTEPGDGVRYKGRGLIQLTGRTNYSAFSHEVRASGSSNLDFAKNPDAVARFPWAAEAAAWFWALRDINRLADRDDLAGITRRINGSLTGLADRARYLVAAREAIAQVAADAAAKATGRRTLALGSRGDDVAMLQHALNHALGRDGAGFAPPLTTDGIFGPMTRDAVCLAQARRTLAPSGVVDSRTWAILQPWLDRVEFEARMSG